MIKLVFEELIMMSHQEKKARKIKFDPNFNVIYGQNDTGKSSLLKSLYHTMGADVPSVNRKWKDASVYTMVTFSVSNVRYSILRFKSVFALFDYELNHIGTYRSITKELAPKIANICNFRLLLQNQSGNDIEQATPAFLFLPFYIDQDAGWQKQLNSFEKLQQFKGTGRNQDTIDYHIGIKTNDYFATKQEINLSQTKLEPLKQKRPILKSIKERMDSKLKSYKFDIDIDAFVNEIQELLTICSEIQKEEEVIKDKLSKLYSQKITLQSQIIIAEKSINELNKDLIYATETLSESNVECPTCGAEYENSFLERFSIAQDEDSCNQLLLELSENLRDVEDKINNEKVAYNTTTLELERKQELLESKQGKITLKELIANEGKVAAKTVVHQDLLNLDNEINALYETIEDSKKKMKNLINKNLEKEIISKYEILLDTYLIKLGVQRLPDKNYKKLYSKINETGSDISRALLAYFYAILKLIFEYSPTCVCPIVIDSPNQQDQDSTSYLSILKFIKNELPENAQLILGAVDTSGVEFEGTQIHLTDKYSVLRKEEYPEIAKLMRPLIKKLY